MPFTNPPQLNGNIFQNHSKSQNRKTARERGTREVAQDKGHLGNAPHKASQPAPFSNGSGARAVNTKTVQFQKTKTGREKRIHSTFHAEPGVRADMDRIADDLGLSFSETVNVACRFYANATIEKRHAEALRDVLRQIVREELQVFGDRIVKFLLRIAFSAEQGKLLSTNILKFVLKLLGIGQNTYVTLVNESGKQAQSNILANTPQFKALFEKWKATDGKEEQAK